MNTESGSHESSSPLLRSMRSTVGRESTAFGFSILVTLTFAVVQATQGPPRVSHVFAYAIGAVMSFTFLEGALSRGFRRPMPQHATQTLNLGTSLNVVSVVAGLAAGWGLSEGTRGLVAWTGAPLVAGLVYLVLESL